MPEQRKDNDRRCVSTALLTDKTLPAAKHLQIDVGKLGLLERNLCQSQDLARQEPKCDFGFSV